MGRRIRRHAPRAHGMLLVLAAAVLLAELSLNACVTGTGAVPGGTVPGGVRARAVAVLDPLIPGPQAGGYRLLAVSGGLGKPAALAAPAVRQARGHALRAARTAGAPLTGALQSLLLVAVVLVGLHLLMQVVAARVHQRRRRPARRPAQHPGEVPVIVPARDEAATIAATGRPVTAASGDPVAVASGDPVTVAPGDPVSATAGDPATVASGDPATAPAGHPVSAASGHPVSGDPATVASGDPATAPAGHPATRPHPGDPYRTDRYRNDPYHASPRASRAVPPTPNRPAVAAGDREHPYMGPSRGKSHWPVN